MVISGSYDHTYCQEIIHLFFGVAPSDIEPATKEEIETFLHLLETHEKYAIDFLNAWLSVKKINSTLSDEYLISIKKLDIISKVKPKKKKGKK